MTLLKSYLHPSASIEIKPFSKQKNNSIGQKNNKKIFIYINKYLIFILSSY